MGFENSSPPQALECSRSQRQEESAIASLGDVHFIDVKDATKLRKAGVRTTESLLRLAAARRDRKRLSEETGLPTSTILSWTRCADIMRVKGIGSEYCELLESVGVRTVEALATSDPIVLARTIVDTNHRRRLVRRVPTEAMIASWVERATALRSTVTA